MLPAAEMYETLKQEGMQDEALILYRELTEHGDWMLERSLSYQKAEVDYEQSIAAPAVDCLVQAYQVSGEEKYLAEAKKQLEVVKLFHAEQPDYHQPQHEAMVEPLRLRSLRRPEYPPVLPLPARSGSMPPQSVHSNNADMYPQHFFLSKPVSIPMADCVLELMIVRLRQKSSWRL